MRRPPVQTRRRGFRIVHVQDQAKLFLQDMGAVQGAVLRLYHGQAFPLPVREVLRVLAECVLRVLDLLRALLRGLCRIFRACAARVLPDGLPLVERTPPCVDAHRVQRVVCPLDDVERIEAPYGVRAMLFDAVRYPPRAVSRHDDDGRALLRR